MEVQCNRCGAAFSVPESKAGQMVSCMCGNRVLVPVPRGPAAGPAPMSGLAMGSMVMGVMSLLTYGGRGTLVLAVGGVLLGILHLLRSHARRGMAITGVATGTVAVLAFALVNILPGGSGSLPVPAVEGRPAPDFRLADIEGKTHTLSQYEGKVVVLNMWATW